MHTLAQCIVRTLLVLAAVGGMLALGNARVHAQASASDEQLARESFENGSRLASERRWAEAEAALSRSIAYKPVAATFINLAIVQLRAGHHLAALRTLDRVTALPAAAMIDAQRARVTELRAEVERSLARRELKVKPAAAHVELDGETVDASNAADRTLWLEPGRHVLRAQHPGFHSTELVFDAVAGSSDALVLRLAPLPAAPATPAAPVVSAPVLATSSLRAERDTTPAHEKSSSLLESPWFWSGAGAVVLGTAIVLLVAPWNRAEPAADGGTQGDVLRP